MITETALKIYRGVHAGEMDATDIQRALQGKVDDTKAACLEAVTVSFCSAYPEFNGQPEMRVITDAINNAEVE